MWTWKRSRERRTPRGCSNGAKDLAWETRGLSLAQRPYLTREESATLLVLLDMSRFRELWREYQHALLADAAERALQRTRGAAG